MANQDDPTIVEVQAREASVEEATAGTNIYIFKTRTQWTLQRLATARVWVHHRLQWFARLKKNADQKDDWRQWSQFRLWRKTRPFAGAILIIIAGLLVLWGPVALLPFALLPGSNIWAGILVGGLILAMGIIQLLVPSNALVAGSIAVVLSLVSLLVAAGGFGIGMLLGIIGGAMGIAWQPVSRSQSRPRPHYKLPSSIKRPFLRTR
ncbi:DUF6114 domain-containing protein [Dictyobacter formicarum]|uniref:Uncharacterized protein n=1 Tax=Dictyobacter formicarum TaxID=2778368 RepID=A0ABQ3VDR9_9CHLR|nr:DUF6114 domain-containing protein [Dictyobacter formicarum]GHO83968.1 hypothetical protein KSZ_19740 [Dictyobacter formicarum]